jgi:hypothetical protein
MQVSGLEKRLANLRPYKPGQNRHTTRRERIDVKLAELIAECFPNGGYSVLDAARLKLAAQHYVDAETCRDPVTRQRATRVAEYLLAKLSAPRPQTVADHASAALELLNRPPDEI